MSALHLVEQDGDPVPDNPGSSGSGRVLEAFPEIDFDEYQRDEASAAMRFVVILLLWLVGVLLLTLFLGIALVIRYF